MSNSLLFSLVQRNYRPGIELIKRHGGKFNIVSQGNELLAYSARLRKFEPLKSLLTFEELFDPQYFFTNVSKPSMKYSSTEFDKTQYQT